MNNKEPRETFLDEFKRFEDLPPNSLCLAYPIPDYGYFTDFQIEFKTQVYRATELVPELVLFHTVYISSTLDRLLCKWIKLKKYISKPAGHQILGLLFLQTKFFGVRNDVFEISSQNCYLGSTPNECLYSPIRRESPCSALRWQKVITTNRLDNYPNDRSDSYVINVRIPFIFVEILDNRETWMLSDESYLAELIPNSETNRFIKRLIPTHSDRIFIISFSQLFQTEKDCAKLMRKVLLYPREIDSFSNC